MAPEPTTPAQPFWGRCGRALVMLLAAAAIHQWLLPRAISPGSTTRPAASAVSAARMPSAPPPRATPAPRVTVVTDEISVPVGTSGVLESPRERTLPARRTEPAREMKALRTPPIEPAAQAEAATLEERVEEPRRAIEPPGDAEADPGGVPEPPAAPPPAPTPTSEVVPAVNHEARVRHLLAQYVAAYERLDVQAAKAVWPTLDEQALKRAFAQLEAQQVTFESCGITIEGRDAHALCQGEATYRPRVGSRTLRLPARQWTFDLSQAANGWQIVDARVR